MELEENWNAAHNSGRDREFDMYDIGVVVLNYVNYAETIKCVQSLLNQKSVSCWTVIVENGSNNESAERLREAFAGRETVSVLDTGKNLGYAKGNNLGIQSLRDEGIQRIFVANSDLEFTDPNTLRQILDACEPGVGLITPVICNLDGSTAQRVVYKKKALYLRIGKHIFKRLLRLNGSQKQRELSSIEEGKTLTGLQNDAYVVSGSGYLLTEEFFRYYSGLYSETFLYYEEWATSILLHKAGLKTKVAACAPITHLGGASTPEDIRNETPRSRKIRNDSARKILKLMFLPRGCARKLTGGTGH